MRIAIIIVALFMASCATQKRCMYKFPVEKKTEVRDTTITVFVPKVIVESDTVSIHDTIPCLITTSKEAKSKRSQVKYSLDKGILKVDCSCDSVIMERDSLQVLLRGVIKNVEEKVIVKTKCKKPYKEWIIIFLLGAWHVGRSYRRFKKYFKFL